MRHGEGLVLSSVLLSGGDASFVDSSVLFDLTLYIITQRIDAYSCDHIPRITDLYNLDHTDNLR